MSKSRLRSGIGVGVVVATMFASACSSSGSSNGAAAGGTSNTGAGSSTQSSSAAAPASILPSGAASSVSVPASGASAGGVSGSAAPAVPHPKVAFMVAGTLGDLGFFDSAEAGLKDAEKTQGISLKTVEGGANASSTWLSDLRQLSNGGNYDVVITGSDQVSDQLKQVAQANPNQHYIMFDQDVSLPNVASITYRQNDGAFLAGVLAALASENKSDFPLSGGNKNVGIVGGMNIPVIQDFVVGFQKGAQSVDPNIKVQTSFVGNFTDSQAGYNQAASMYANGADVVFAAAGGAGLGVLKASHDKNKYSIGVDSNQNSLYPKHVLASDLKNVGASLEDVLKKLENGNLVYGQDYVYGIENGGVSLALNKDLVPSSASSKLDQYKQKVVSGQIDVPCVQPFCAKATK